MTEQGEHRRLRELLGAYALGGLELTAVDRVKAHLDGCAECRAELAEIAPLAADLRAVDPSRVRGLASPPSDLGDRIRARVAEEHHLVQARRVRDAEQGRRRRGARRVAQVAAAVVLIAASVGIGSALERSTQQAPPAVVAVEAVALVPVGRSDLAVTSAGLIAHTWGVEVKLKGSGFAQGEVFRAAFRTERGTWEQAGEFLGTGASPVTCNLQSARLRSGVTAFAVMDSSGTPVLTAELPVRS